MKGKFNRLTAIIALTVTAMLFCTGCFDDGNIDTSGWVNESGLEPIELTWYVNIEAFTKRFGDTLTDREIYRKTGVKIKFSNADSLTGDQKLTSMSMSNSLTDLVSLPYSTEICNQLIKAGRLWSMEDLFKAYPSVQDFIPDDMYDWCATDIDGKLYGLRTHFFGDSAQDLLLTNNVLVGNLSLLEKYNLDPQEDFSTMAKFIESCDKVYKGERVATPGFIPFFSSNGGEDLHEFLAIPKEDSAGNWMDWHEADEGKELAVLMNKMYRKGLITEGVITGQITQREAVLTGKTFIVMMNFASQQYNMWDSYTDNGEQYVAVGPVLNEAGDAPMLSPWNSNGYMSTCISKRCSNPDRALKLLEYLYSDEGQILSVFGIEDDSYYIEDGKYYMTNKYYSMTADEQNETYGNAWYETLTSKTPFWRTLSGVPKQDPAKFTQEIFNFFSGFTYDMRAYADIDPVDPTSGLIAAMSGASAYFKWTQIITSANSSKSDAEARQTVISTMNQQLASRNSYTNYDKVVEYRNNKFKANKQKLGINYAWPSNAEKYGN